MPTTSKGLRYPAPGASPNVAADIQNLATDVNAALGGGAWSTYTPTWTSNGATTQPTIGNGTLSGRYRKLDDYTGALKIILSWGSTTSGGNGTATQGYRFTLPAGWTHGPIAGAIPGWYTATADQGPLTGLIDLGASVISVARADNNNAVVANGLLTAAGNFLLFSGVIELA